MAILKNRRIAVLCCGLMILLGILLGAWRSAGRLYGQVEEIFYNGEEGDGIGVASDLSGRAGTAVNMIIVAKRNMDPDHAAITDLEGAVTVAHAAYTLTEKQRADRAMEVCMQTLYDAMGEISMDEKDANYRESLYAQFTSSGMTMSHDPYNAQAVEYNQALDTFPASILFPLFGYDAAPVFR